MEDDGIEFKRELPSDTQRAARQIAGMANAARGEQFLWVVGVDEATRAIQPVSGDLAAWWDRVSARFDGEAPVLTNDPRGGRHRLGLRSCAPPLRHSDSTPRE